MEWVRKSRKLRIRFFLDYAIRLNFFFCLWNIFNIFNHPRDNEHKNNEKIFQNAPGMQKISKIAQ